MDDEVAKNALFDVAIIFVSLKPFVDFALVDSFFAGGGFEVLGMEQGGLVIVVLLVVELLLLLLLLLILLVLLILLELLILLLLMNRRWLQVEGHASFSVVDFVVTTEMCL